MNQNFYNWGLPVGGLFGIKVRLHFLLLIFWAIQLNLYLKGAAVPRDAFLEWAIATSLFFVIILLHEFGHCFAARKVGGSATEVLLWPLGGLAFTQYPQTWRKTLIVIGGGPMVNVAIAILAIPIFYLAERSNPALADNLVYSAFYDVLFKWNLVMLVFNLIPLFPLDGGQLFRAGMWGWFEKKGGMGDGPFYHASKITVPVSLTIGAIGVVVCLYFQQFLGVGIFVWAMLNTWQLKKQLENMSSLSIDRGNEFGYDFSEGYTSLAKGPGGSTASSTQKISKSEQKRKAKKKRSKEDDERRMDVLFKKINDEGIHSLTKAERQFLEEMSKRM
ncbi:MAG: stage IV sporulation protein FB [Verrucomicrobiales bacterium]|jgi:stage IV sporulation protein FB